MTQEKLQIAKQQAEEASQAKSKFLNHMSHEIRTPMVSIIAHTELLLKTDMSAEQNDLIISIKSSSQILLELISDIFG